MAKKNRTASAPAPVKSAPAPAPAKRSLFGLPLFLGLSLLAFLIFQLTSGGSANAVPRYGFKVIRKIPHDKTAFTEGLIFQNGFFYESTGQNGASSVRRMDPQSGEVLQRYDMEKDYFGEGLTFCRGVLVQLTWQEKKAFVYNSETLTPLREYPIEGEGWGLTHDGENYVMSDGSSQLTFRDSEFRVVQPKLDVTFENKPVSNLNELEYIDGEIWANVWKTWEIVRISPKTGQVVGRINLKGLIASADIHGREDFLNGIAYDPQTKSIYVTGKYFAYIYQIELTQLDP